MNHYLILFMFITMASFLVIQVLLGLVIRELFRDLKDMQKELSVLMGLIMKISTAQDHICKILHGMMKFTSPGHSEDDGR